MATQINGKTRCVIIAGAPDPDIAFIRQMVTAQDFVVCADRGYAAALQAGVAPDCCIGDFDSYRGALPEGCEIVRLNPEKDFSDTFHGVEAALARGFRSFVLLAATGGRLDHTCANLSVLAYLHENGADGIILSKNEEIRLLTEGEHIFNGRAGKTFSVFPFGCPAVTLSYRGAKYPLARGTLSYSKAMGLSNIFTQDAAAVTVHSGTALLFINQIV